MSDRASETHFIGPLGSEFWQIQVDPEAVPLLASKIDWNGLGRRVMIDPIAGIISWMSPASTHEDLAEATDEIVKAAGQIIKGRVRGMRGTRWKRPEDPRNTGLEADASFYIGTKAEQWYAAIRQGWDKVEEFETRTPPDLVVEVEITHLDKDKPARYARLGISEMWQVTRRSQQDQYRIEVTILDLQAHGVLVTTLFQIVTGYFSHIISVPNYWETELI